MEKEDIRKEDISFLTSHKIHAKFILLFTNLFVWMHTHVQETGKNDPSTQLHTNNFSKGFKHLKVVLLECYVLMDHRIIEC